MRESAVPAALNGAATAAATEVDAFDTIPLEGLSLSEGEFLLLVDTTPSLIQSGHVALHIPCEVDGNDAETDIGTTQKRISR